VLGSSKKVLQSTRGLGSPSVQGDRVPATRWSRERACCRIPAAASSRGPLLLHESDCATQKLRASGCSRNIQHVMWSCKGYSNSIRCLAYLGQSNLTISRFPPASRSPVAVWLCRSNVAVRRTWTVKVCAWAKEYSGISCGPWGFWLRLRCVPRLLPV